MIDLRELPAQPELSSHEDYAHPRSHGADRLRDPQRLHLVLDHDDQPGGGRDRCGARGQAGDRLRLLLQRPLCAGRHPARALHSAHHGGRARNRSSTRPTTTSIPFAVWKAFMANEKPGGHGDRAHAAGALDMAVWDAVAKIAGKPLWRLLSERFNGGQFDEKVLVYPGGGYYYPGKELEGLRAEMRGYQEQGYKVVKMKIGGGRSRHGPEAHRGGDRGRRRGRQRRRRRQRPLRPCHRARLRQGDASPTACSGTRSRAIPSTTGSTPCSRSTMPGALATGENLFSAIDGRNLLRYGGLRPDRDWVQLDPALAYGLTEYLRFLDVAERGGLVAAAASSRTAGISWPSTSPPACSSAARRAIPACSSPTAASPTRSRSSTATSPARGARHRHGAASAQMFAEMRKRLELAWTTLPLTGRVAKRALRRAEPGGVEPRTSRV